MNPLWLAQSGYTNIAASYSLRAQTLLSAGVSQGLLNYILRLRAWRSWGMISVRGIETITLTDFAKLHVSLQWLA